MIKNLFGGYWELKDGVASVEFVLSEYDYVHYLAVRGYVNGVLEHTRTGEYIILEDAFYKEDIYKEINTEKFQKGCVRIISNRRGELDRAVEKSITQWLKYHLNNKRRQYETTDSQLFKQMTDQKLTVRLDNLKIK